MGNPLLCVEFKDILAVNILHHTLGAAGAANGGAVFLEIEVVAMAVGTYALGAAVVLADDAVRGLEGAVRNLLRSSGQILADGMGAGNGLIVHNDVQGPLEAVVVNERPLGGQGLIGKVTLNPGGPVGATDAHVGNGNLL